MEQRGPTHRFVIAIGGNAIAPSGRSEEDQQSSASVAMEQVARLLHDGHEVVLTHGNGPQVGHLLAQNEIAAATIPPNSLEVCVAQTQASIGLMMAVALEKALASEDVGVRPVTVVTRVGVSLQDPAWTAPTKPIGGPLDADGRKRVLEAGHHVVSVDRLQWRRVVASPDPLEVVDLPAIESLLASKFVPIVAGGGGVPGVREGTSWRGVNAVLDKDLTAALLGRRLNADRLVIATDVSNVIVHYGLPEARPLHRVTVGEIRSLASLGHFPAGSMGPKVEAAARFVEHGRGRAVITSLNDIYAAANDGAGTIVELGDQAA